VKFLTEEINWCGVFWTLVAAGLGVGFWWLVIWGAVEGWKHVGVR
jgi:hypothetical protein